ncbi:MAG: TonB-dependent receptor [Gammaproteobacteria bacterium]|nr:TonB-dependent receptor [Gammaproteobacteria bacterium]
MNPQQRFTTPREKALAVNLDPRRYGTFAEIGAGQEVVRWFFQAGGAAGTIAKSISAYDMQVSDAIYGDCERYVCRERLEAMLECEHRLNLQRLSTSRGERTAFFAFADTVVARSYHGTGECHGWMGVRFQATPGDEDSQIIVHMRMLDHENAAQQEALGILGVNLLYGACFLSREPDTLLESLLDGLSTTRIEIDMVEFSGIEFRRVDNRIMTLKLVQLGLTAAAMFAADGGVLQPSAVLRKRPVLIQRGRFRPVTHVNLDILEAAQSAFERQSGVAAGESLTLMEMTMQQLRSGERDIDLRDFIARAEVLEATGHTVMISDYFEYYRLAAYLWRYTHRPIGVAMGIPALRELLDEQFYAHLEGGILESFGRLFKGDLKLFVYPLLEPGSGELVTIDTLEVPSALHHLFAHLRERGCLVPLEQYRAEHMHIFSPDVLGRIGNGDRSWEGMVPSGVAAAIKSRALFGYRPGA